MRNEKDSKDVVQSYLITTARYKFSTTEKRIMYRIVEAGQDLIEGNKLRGHITVQENLLRDREVTMGYADITDDYTNYKIVRNALLELGRKLIVWGNAKEGGAYSLIERPKWNERRGIFSFRVPAPIWDAMMLQYEKGFRKYQLATAMSFSSVYSMRLYELVSGQKSPLTYKVEEIKTMLGVSGKYPRLYDFKKRVLIPAKTELDDSADYSFDYIIKGSGQNATVMFLPYPMVRGDKAEANRLKQQISVNSFLPTEVATYLQTKFTKKEIKTHLEMFREACSTLPDIMLTLAELFAKSRDKENPKGWIIQSLRGKIKDIK